jgi:hypothetical protein
MVCGDRPGLVSLLPFLPLFPRPISARGNVLQAHDVERIEARGIALSVSDDHRPRGQEKVIRMRDRVSVPAGSDDCKRSELTLKSRAKVVHIHKRILCLPWSSVKKQTVMPFPAAAPILGRVLSTRLVAGPNSQGSARTR